LIVELAYHDEAMKVGKPAEDSVPVPWRQLKVTCTGDFPNRPAASAAPQRPSNCQTDLTTVLVIDHLTDLSSWEKTASHRSRTRRASCNLLVTCVCLFTPNFNPDRPRLSHSTPLFNFPNEMPHQAVVDRPPEFDTYAFRKYMSRMGRAYRNQAIVLIGICLSFSKAAEQSFTQDAELSE